MNFKLPEIPFRTPLVKAGNVIDDLWNRWLNSLVQRAESTLWVAGSSLLSGQGASIGATALVTSVPPGLYRLEYYMRVTQAATVSSSLTYTVNWTDGAVAQTYSWSALTGNTTTTVQSAATMLRADAGSAISYEIAYASVGATPMVFRSDTVLSKVGSL